MNARSEEPLELVAAGSETERKGSAVLRVGRGRVAPIRPGPSLTLGVTSDECPLRRAARTRRGVKRNAAKRISGAASWTRPGRTHPPRPLAHARGDKR